MASTEIYQTVGSTTENKIFTFSAWVKRGGLGAYQTLIQANGDPASVNYIGAIQFTDSDQIRFIIYHASTLGEYITNAVYRDTSAWYHIVLSVDTTQATASNRVKLYVNGEEVTSFATETDPSQNQTLQFNTVDSVVNLGSRYSTSGSSQYFNGSMAHVHFIDGTAYDADDFGETDSASGIWKPKPTPSVTYGTNGFFLNFANSSDLGNDVSGNNNDFTMSGTGTQTLDTPSNVFATWNGVFNLSGTLSNGNNTYATSTSYGSQGNTATSTLGVSSGKYYAEFKHGGTSGTFPNGMVGVYYNPEKFQNGATNPAQSNDEGFGYAENGIIYNNGSTDTGTTYTTGDIIGVALDLDGSKVYWYKNGTLVNSGGTTIDAGETYFFFVADTSSGGSTTYQANFGNGIFGTTAVSTPESDSAGLGKFEYSVLSGYYALCTKNIADYG